MHTSRIVQAGGIPIYIAMVVSARLIHLLTMMAVGGGVNVVIDVLVIGASGWVVSGTICAVDAGVAVCAVAGAVGVGGVGVASHFADCLVEGN